MIKLFDYKFLITLGLSLVVYFLYREVDILNKRVNELEHKSGEPTKKKKQLIELPEPPQLEPQKREIKVHIEQIQEFFNKVKPNNTLDLNMVEEYSNEDIKNIYSHDNLHTNTNDQDTLMVESIINMTKQEENKQSSENKPLITNLDNDVVLQESNESSNYEINDSLKESIHNDEEQIIETESVNNEEIKLTKNVISLDVLNKKKLDELQELAIKNNIDINNENGKKKKKTDLALEIYNKQ
jgi:hypothetical protein